ncbi:uncharacterized protein LOC142335118 isoform X2 [Convolutriloba macropyga]|uniref:uncharacterized protein LOC142335118 isoform X2 n=1 Tax=Convolutriloba macropyga TaxID=536237 RepID=UPI003F528BCE
MLGRPNKNNVNNGLHSIKGYSHQQFVKTMNPWGYKEEKDSCQSIWATADDLVDTRMQHPNQHMDHCYNKQPNCSLAGFLLSTPQRKLQPNVDAGSNTTTTNILPTIMTSNHTLAMASGSGMKVGASGFKVGTGAFSGLREEPQLSSGLPLSIFEAANKKWSSYNDNRELQISPPFEHPKDEIFMPKSSENMSAHLCLKPSFSDGCNINTPRDFVSPGSSNVSPRSARIPEDWRRNSVDLTIASSPSIERLYSPFSGLSLSSVISKGFDSSEDFPDVQDSINNQDPIQAVTDLFVSPRDSPFDDLIGRRDDEIRQPISDEEAVGNDIINHKKFKTKLCRSVTSGTICGYADRCQYAHNSQELRPSKYPINYKTIKCRQFHATGKCLHAGRCTFLHDMNPIEKQMMIEFETLKGFDEFLMNL